ncbi:hypothetical protein SODALDRAFT_328804 [Sodiomyces alkalinus F11]|uniref:Uncharacterized protein n=1 Tax=Sodiomyces alkalinus (strain CBS 110278 / VKM F-3762 / F11) TaxID=1314773 RepID=A0A3N2PLV2_SODAK|nr:hypothetical protein SODALDRAFT_328804 [Sodiomyces alkalinus F11]ROT35459.1 hypothetical protein SODALDRAFT_328804 [Sodiomyces alkalinus F11]
MASTAPRIHLVDKSDYTKQKVVPLPDAYPLPPLQKGFIRIRSRILSLTTNNFSYARFGEELGWYSVWPTLPSLSAPYNDATKYGRISSWGYGEAIESAHDDVPVGTKLFGYLPIGTLPEDLQVKPMEAPGHLLEVSERRTARVMPFYNRYVCYPPDVDLSAERGARGLEALLRPLFEAGYLLNRYTFAGPERKPLHPLGHGLPWTAQQADISDAVLVLLGASGKTSLSLADQLRHARTGEAFPRKVVAVGSEASRGFTQRTGLFDEVLLYDDVDKTNLAAVLALDKATKVVLLNFAGRGDAPDRWASRLREPGGPFTGLSVGGDPTNTAPGNFNAEVDKEGSGVYMVSAPTLRDDAILAEGEAKYFEFLDEAWTRFIDDRGGLHGVSLMWRQDIGAFESDWDGLCKGKGQYGPDIGLVYEI